MKIFKFHIILFLILISLNSIYCQEYTQKTIYFLRDFDFFVLEKLQDEIKDKQIKEWIVKHFDGDTKESELKMKFDNNGNRINLIYKDNVIKKPFSINSSYDEMNNLEREEIFYEGSAPYQRKSSIKLLKRIYDDKGRITQFFRENINGYTKEKSLDEYKNFDHQEKYFYGKNDKIEMIEYSNNNKLQNVKKYYYHENDNIKEFQTYRSNRLIYTEQYDKNENIIYTKYQTSYSTNEEFYNYDERGNLLEYKKTYSSSKLSYNEKTISNKYDINSNLIESIKTTFNKNKKISEEIKIINSYNDQNQLLGEKKYKNNRFIFDVKYEYDDKKNISKKKDYNKKGDFNSVEIYTYGYNDDNLIVQIIKKYGHPKLEKRMKTYFYVYEYIK